jgi:hypothetical protein
MESFAAWGAGPVSGDDGDCKTARGTKSPPTSGMHRATLSGNCLVAVGPVVAAQRRPRSYGRTQPPMPHQAHARSGKSDFWLRSVGSGRARSSAADQAAPRAWSPLPGCAPPLRGWRKCRGGARLGELVEVVVDGSGSVARKLELETGEFGPLIRPTKRRNSVRRCPAFDRRRYQYSGGVYTRPIRGHKALNLVKRGLEKRDVSICSDSSHGGLLLGSNRRGVCYHACYHGT